MTNTLPFSTFTKQSKKGIVVLYIDSLYAFLKATWILFLVFFQKFSDFTGNKLTYIYIGIAVLIILLFLTAYLRFINFKFKVNNGHFILKKGVFKKTNTAIPFDRIQNINFKQNIIQQLINVHEVNIETAGSTKAEVSIKALSYKNAKALKELLSVYTSSIKKEPEVDVAKKTPLLNINFLALLKVSITENHLQSLSLLIAILLGFYQQISDVLEGLGKADVLDNYLSKPNFSITTSVLLVIELVLFLIVIAVLSSFVRVLFKHFNLTVFLNNNALEINQGLTTKKSIVLKKQKVQYIVISTNFLKRFFDISSVVFKQAASGQTKKPQDKIIKIVGCSKHQLSEIKTLLFSITNLDNFTRLYPNNYYKFRLITRALLIVTIVNLLFLFGFDTLKVFWLNFAILPVTIGVIYLILKKRYYYFNKDMVFLNSGSIQTNTAILPFYKVQNVAIKQTIFQAKKNCADVVFQTASGKLKIPCIALDKANKLYNYTLFKIETSTQLWM